MNGLHLDYIHFCPLPPGNVYLNYIMSYYVCFQILCMGSALTNMHTHPVS